MHVLTKSFGETILVMAGCLLLQFAVIWIIFTCVTSQDQQRDVTCSGKFYNTWTYICICYLLRHNKRTFKRSTDVNGVIPMYKIRYLSIRF